MSVEAGVRRERLLDGAWTYIPDQAGELTPQQAEQQLSDGAARQMELPTNWWFTELGDFYGVVWFSRQFDPEPQPGASTILRFEAVDYIADVWLNGTYLGRHEGMFAPFEFAVSGILRTDGPNTVLVRVNAPWDDTDAFLVDSPYDVIIKEEPYKRHWPREIHLIKGGHIDHMHKPGGFTSFWQDGNTGGIWNSVKLIHAGEVTITGSKVYCKVVEETASPEGMIAIDLTLDNHSQVAQEVDVAVDVAPDNFEAQTQIPSKTKRVVVPPGRHVTKVVHTIRDPRQWDTWDHGYPHLYRVTIGVRVGDTWADRQDVVTGFKDLRVDPATKQFFLNGRRIFIRGMRYFSAHWMSEAPERYQGDLEQIKAANQNAIRIGSHVERGEFYDLCDRMGFLVWQVFPLHYCVSDSDDMIERASEQIREMVAGLYNHVSIGVWSTFKEPEVYGDPSNKPNNYNRLCEILAETARSVDATRWVHKGDYRDNVQNMMPGCLRPSTTDLNQVDFEPIVIEYGAQGIPSLDSLREILPEEDIWPPNWDKWARLGFFPGQLPNLGVPVGDSIEEFIENTQRVHAYNTKEMVEYLRRRKYNPISAFFYYYWREQFPGIGNGLIDYWGRPLQALAMMGPACAPLLVSVEWVKDRHIIGLPKTWKAGGWFEANIWVTNDELAPIEGCRLETRIQRGDEVLHEQRQDNVAVPLDSSIIKDRVLWRLPAGQAEYKVDVTLAGDTGETLSKNYFGFSTF